MGKRDTMKHERSLNDFYRTPLEAVYHLLPHINSTSSYYEPCYGKGHLVEGLKKFGLKCNGFSDLEIDATSSYYNTFNFDYFITNPPWKREILHKIIENLCKQKPTWLLFDADWKETSQAAYFLNNYCVKIVASGRFNWIDGTGNKKGYENSSWYLFRGDGKYSDIEFVAKKNIKDLRKEFGEFE